MTAVAAGRSEVEIPELSALTDPRAMLPVLAATVEPSLLAGWEVIDVAVVSVRNRSYDNVAKRSKSSTQATYRLSLVDREKRRTDEVDLYLRAFLDPARAERHIANAPSAVRVPGLHASAWLLGGDPALPALRRLTDEHQVIGFLPPELDRVEAATVTPLRYKPEDRCTLQVTVRRTGRAPSTLVAKTMSSVEAAARLHRIATALWHRALETDASFVVPRVLGHSPSDATLWLSWLRGRSPRRRDLDRAAIGRIAAALASLHASSPPDLGDERTEPVLDETLRKVRVLARNLGGDELAGLSAGLEQLHSDPAIGERRLVHGAFRLRQLLLDKRDRVGIVDLDDVGLDDPLGDVADFMLDLDPTLGGDGPNTSVAGFVGAYRNETGQPIDRHRLRWQLASKLIKRAYWLRTTARHQPATASELLRRVRLAEQLAGGRPLGLDGG